MLQEVGQWVAYLYKRKRSAKFASELIFIFQGTSVMICGSGWPSVRVTRARVMGKEKRRGPALPGLR